MKLFAALTLLLFCLPGCAALDRLTVTKEHAWNRVDRPTALAFGPAGPQQSDMDEPKKKEPDPAKKSEPPPRTKEEGRDVKKSPGPQPGGGDESGHS